MNIPVADLENEWGESSMLRHSCTCVVVYQGQNSGS
jgi:hypothetical protein